MSRAIIINADDFGYNDAITDGIIEAHRNGIVRSTTLMANMPGAARACDLVGSVPDMSVGIHLTLSQYRPLLDAACVPSLVGPDGNFLSFAQAARKACLFRFKSSELEAEIEAQVQFLLDRGVVPTHWDSHHHLCMYPQTQLAALRVARRMGIRRQRIYRYCHCVDRLAGGRGLRAAYIRLRACNLHKAMYYRASMSLARAYFGMKTPDWVMTARRMLTDVPSADRLRLWARLLANCPHGVSESFCHPGHAHEDPQDSPAMRARRVEELKILTSHEIRDSVEEHGIELISYRDI